MKKGLPEKSTYYEIIRTLNLHCLLSTSADKAIKSSENLDALSLGAKYAQHKPPVESL